MESGKGLKTGVLAVDDDPLVHRTLALDLSDEYAILPASTAKEALAILSRDDIRLILLDIQMPEISGLELLKMVRQWHPAVPVIMLSGVQEIDTVVEAMKVGASGG